LSQPEPIDLLLGGSNDEATTAASTAAHDSLINSGVSNSTASSTANLTNGTGTADEVDQKLKGAEASVAAGKAAVDRALSQACQVRRETTHCFPCHFVTFSTAGSDKLPVLL
jgi:hypothetical protein